MGLAYIFLSLSGLSLVLLVWLCIRTSGMCSKWERDYNVVTEQDLRIMKELCER